MSLKVGDKVICDGEIKTVLVMYATPDHFLLERIVDGAWSPDSYQINQHGLDPTKRYYWMSVGFDGKEYFSEEWIKKQYPLGTVYRPAHIPPDNTGATMTVKNHSILFGAFLLYIDNSDWNSAWAPCVWDKNKWADIISKPIGDVVSPSSEAPVVNKVHAESLYWVMGATSQFLNKLNDKGKVEYYIDLNIGTSTFTKSTQKGGESPSKHKQRPMTPEEIDWLERCNKAGKMVERYPLGGTIENPVINNYELKASTIHGVFDTASFKVTAPMAMEMSSLRFHNPHPTTFGDFPREKQQDSCNKYYQEPVIIKKSKHKNKLLVL